MGSADEQAMAAIFGLTIGLVQAPWHGVTLKLREGNTARPGNQVCSKSP